MADPLGPDWRRERVRLPKASDVLADELRRRIFTNGLKPGDRLPSEAQLIETQQLSRATVREALRILETEELVTIRRGPRGGVVVRYPDPTHVARALASLLTLSSAPLRDVFEFRAATEPAAASAAARTATSDQVDLLVRLAADSSDHAEIQFHLVVAESTNNMVVHVLLGSLIEVVRQHAQREQLDATDRAEACAAHQRIADAIRSGEEAEAASLMSAHIAAFQKRMEGMGRLDEPILPREGWGG